MASDGGIARALDVGINAAVLLKDQAAEELASASAAVKALHARLASEAEGREMEGLGKRLELANQCKSSAQADFERRVATYAELLQQKEQSMSSGPSAAQPSLVPPSTRSDAESVGLDDVFYFTYDSGRASGSQSRKFKSCGPCPMLFPTYDATDPPRVFTALRPTAKEVTDAVLAVENNPLQQQAGTVFFLDGKSVLEQTQESHSRPLTVALTQKRVAPLYAERGVRTAFHKSLQDLKLPAVYCLTACVVDMAYCHDVGRVRRVLAVHEFKAPGIGPRVGVHQVVKYACSAAAGLCQAGVDPDGVVVPWTVSNGHEELHGAAYMAAPCLPLAVVPSPVLDLYKAHDAAAAHVFRVKAARQTKLSIGLLQAAKESSSFLGLQATHGRSAPPFAASFSLSTIWPKWGGVNVTAESAEGDHVVLFRVFEVFAVLYASSASTNVCFPHCYLTGISNGHIKCDQALLFPNLKRDGYQCALPTDESVIKLFINALKQAVAKIHEAGVIHGDLYLSNVMWRLSEDKLSVEIKVIDWDTAFLARGKVPPDWEALWRDTPKWALHQDKLAEGVCAEVAVQELDLFMVNVINYCAEQQPRPWRAATDMSSDVYSLNDVFWVMQEQYAQHVLESNGLQTGLALPEQLAH